MSYGQYNGYRGEPLSNQVPLISNVTYQDTNEKQQYIAPPNNIVYAFNTNTNLPTPEANPSWSVAPLKLNSLVPPLNFGNPSVNSDISRYNTLAYQTTPLIDYKYNAPNSDRAYSEPNLNIISNSEETNKFNDFSRTDSSFYAEGPNHLNRYENVDSSNNKSSLTITDPNNHSVPDQNYENFIPPNTFEHHHYGGNAVDRENTFALPSKPENYTLGYSNGLRNEDQINKINSYDYQALEHVPNITSTNNSYAPDPQVFHTYVNEDLASNYSLTDRQFDVEQQNPPLDFESSQQSIPYEPAINESLRNSINLGYITKPPIKTYLKPNCPFNFHTDKSNIFPLKIYVNHSLTDIEPPVETASKYWIKIDLMKLVAKHNPNHINCVDELRFRHKIVAWKKSRGDGNCYFRAVICRYVEIIFGFYSDLENCKIFQEIIKNLQDKYGNNYKISKEYKDSIFYIQSCLEILIDKKSTEPYKAFETALYWLQQTEFDINLVRVSRLICYYAYHEKKQEWKEIKIYNKETKIHILEMGREAEGLILLLLPFGLNIQVVQYNIFKSLNIETFPNNDESNIKVSIVRRSGHYDILYTIQECELDLYNCDMATYHYIYYNASY